MAITKNKKQEILKNLEEKAKKASSVVFVNFHGLNVVKTTQLRRSLRNLGADYLVGKKTLIKKAFDSLKFKGEMPELEGEIALAFGDKDAVAPAKGIADFQKENKDSLKILGGVLEGEYMSVEKAIALSNIPSREVLYGKFVNVINSPIQGAVGALNGIIRSFVNTLDQIAKNK